MSIEFLLEPGSFNALRLSICESGKKLSAFSSAIPSDMRSLARQTASYGSVEQSFAHFLISSHTDYPIIVPLDGDVRHFRWDPEFVMDSCTECYRSSDYVRLSRAGVIEDQVYDYLYRIGESFVVDMDSSKFGLVKDTGGWEVWQVAKKFLEESIDDDVDVPSDVASGDPLEKLGTFITMTHDQFNEFQTKFSSEEGLLSSLIFRSEEESSEVQKEFGSHYRVVLSWGEDRQFIDFDGNCYVGGTRVGLYQPLWEFFKDLFKLPAPLTSQKCRVDILAVLRKLLEKVVDGEELVLPTQLSPDQYPTQDSRTAVRLYLERFKEILESTQDRAVIVEETWGTIKTDLFTEVRLYLSILEVFEMVRFHQLDRLSFDLPKETVFGLLEPFKSKLAEAGVEVYFDDKPLKVVSWDFFIDARSKSDFFELHPHILQEGVPIPEMKWSSILNVDGLFDQDETMILLDDKTKLILSQLMGLISESKKTTSEARNIVSLSRLQILDIFYLKKQGLEVKLSMEEEALYQMLLGFKSIKKKPMPKHFNGTLREYQQDGYNWLNFLFEFGFGACLADDMGLGKTIQTICFLGAIKEGLLLRKLDKDSPPFLIVVPPSLRFNWQQEIEKFYPEFKILQYKRSGQYKHFDDVDVVLISYELVRRDIDVLSQYSFPVIAFDEAQYIKNIFAGRTAAVRQLKAQFRVCLTGTPLENHLGEYYSILDVCVPGLLGSYRAFQLYLRDREGNDYDRLIKRTRPFVLRRTKETILSELPPKIETDVYLELTAAQKKLYLAIVNEVKSTIESAYQSKSPEQARIVALTALMRLRQVCVTPQLIDPDFDKPSPKIEYLVDKVCELRKEGHSALIFSQFRSFLDILSRHFEREGINFFRMDGKTSMAKRGQLIKDFQSSEDPEFFLISLKTGGVGLNLIKASYVFHLDPWWNPSVENQASDRVHRIGQTQKVFVNRLLMHGTIEEKMMSLKASKQALFDLIVNDGISRTGKKASLLTKEDLDYLLDF